MAGLLRVLARFWIPLVLVAVLAISGLAMNRRHGIFGTHIKSGAAPAAGDDIVEFNPKRVVYEIEGPSGTSGHVSYLDADAQPHTESFSSLPWRHEVVTTLPTVFANLVAQGDSDVITCRIVVNGEVRDTQTVNQHHAQAFCLEKAA
ncbi:MmpS family transport accessory protein [Mycobacterium sp. LTG2003]